MTPDLKELSDRIGRLTGRAAEVEDQLKAARQELIVSKKSLRRHKRASEIIMAVASLTQMQVEELLSKLVTDSLRAVFGDKYSFQVRYVTKRSKPFCQMTLLNEDGDALDPMTMCGGSVVDVIAFSLRVVLLLLQEGDVRRTLVFDEPFRFVSTDLRPKVARMVRELSRSLGIQMIIVTHEDSIIDAADKVFRIKEGALES